MSTRGIRAEIAAGRLTRVRRGWYATPTTPPAIATAARVGGRLTCLQALRLHGCWVVRDDEVHVRVADGVAVARCGSIRVHWTPERVRPGVDPPVDALRTALECLDLRTLVVAADSLVQRGILGRSDVAGVLGSTPRGRRALELHDPRAESGIETVVRLALRRLRVHVTSQAVIRDVGRVDFLVGERLVIEVDGFEWHGSREAFERDRVRDRELVRRGYVVIRVSYRQALHDLDAVVVAVRDLVRRREHRWRSVHRTQLSAEGYLVDVSLRYPVPAES